MKKTWQKILTESITDVEELAKLLKFDKNNLVSLKLAHQDFPLKIPKVWLKKIKLNDLNDPLLLQVLPQGEELKPIADFELDPLKEKEASPLPGLLHKYRSRVLLITTGACGINCRYCFRRNFPYAEHRHNQQQWQAAIDYILQHPEVNEVILSGGDPLLAPDSLLQKLSEQLSVLPQIKTLRIHTRLPVFIPERLDKDFMDWFITPRFKSVMVLHINHPNEIDSRFAKKMLQLKKRGVTLLNQSVLLKGVNNDAQVLQELSQRLFFECGIQPYYLNLLDKVKGAGHFAITQQEALKIYHELLSLLPGYLVPKLVTEQPGNTSKMPMI